MFAGQSQLALIFKVKLDLLLIIFPNLQVLEYLVEPCVHLSKVFLLEDVQLPP
jgi:hypothetical protein